jgi:hypothetical protein
MDGTGVLLHRYVNGTVCKGWAKMHPALALRPLKSSVLYVDG